MKTVTGYRVLRLHKGWHTTPERNSYEVVGPVWGSKADAEKYLIKVKGIGLVTSEINYEEV